jgi:hypothetical protein
MIARAVFIQFTPCGPLFALGLLIKYASVDQLLLESDQLLHVDLVVPPF